MLVVRYVDMQFIRYGICPRIPEILVPHLKVTTQNMKQGKYYTLLLTEGLFPNANGEL